MILKLTAWGVKQYSQDYWNYLDGILAITSVIGFIIERILTDTFPLNAGIFRIIRLGNSFQITNVILCMLCLNDLTVPSGLTPEDTGLRAIVTAWSSPSDRPSGSDSGGGAVA